MQVNSPYGQMALIPYDGAYDKGFLLPGAEAWVGEDKAASLIFQQYTRDTFTIRLYRWRIEKKGTYRLRAKHGALISALALKGSCKHALPKDCHYMLREGQYLIMYQPGDDWDFVFEKAQEYTQIHFCFSNKLLEYYKEALDHSVPQPRQPATGIETGWISNHMNSAVQHLLNNQYTKVVRDFFYENKARGLLLLLMAEKEGDSQLTSPLTPAETEALHKAKNLIITNLQTHINISKLSRQVQLNEFKLKIGFKLLFGTGPFGFLKNERLQQSHELLLHSDKPLKEIASIAGYSSLSSFIAAFRKHFGYTPGDLRYK